MHLVDTNVLVHAVNRASPDHERCAEAIHALANGAAPWYCTWGIAYEYLRVVTHLRVLPRPLGFAAAWAVFRAMQAEGGLRMLRPTDRHAVLVDEIAATMPDLRGNLMHDLEIVVTMREHGISRIVTRDRDFHRFAGIMVMDPMAL